MKDIGDPFDLWKVETKLSYCSEYLEAIEGFLEGEVKELDNRLDTEIQRLKQDEDFLRGLDGLPVTPQDLVWLHFEEDYERLKTAFPRILRSSLFLFIYSVLESGLNDCCSLLSFQGTSLADEPPGDRGIQKAKKYLESAMVHFPDTAEWDKILDYQKLRNCLVHGEGRLPNCRYATHFRKYALRNPNLEWEAMSLAKRGTDEKTWAAKTPKVRGEIAEKMAQKYPRFDRIIIHKDFCEEVLQTVRVFLGQLKASLKDRQRGEDF